MKRRIISIMLAICMVFLSVPISVNAMSIYVDLSIIGETTLTIEVESGDSIENVKEKIKNETGYPERNQRLKYNGKVLKDGRTLADYNIQKYNTIELSFAPSVSAYVTKEQMMDGTFAPNESGVALNTGKLVFGKNSSGASQQWYILGKDSGVSGDNTIIFAASPIATNQVFNSSTSDKTYNYGAGTGYGEPAGSTTVYANHYGASDLRVTLQTMATDSNYFTAAEQGMMNPTTVTTKDKNNSATYITTDKLYALQGDENYNNDKYLWAGTSDSTVLAKNSYWSSGDTFWLRSPYDFSDISALLAYPGSCVYCGRVNGEGAVQPASNLNLSSVLFASAATAASSGTVSGTITDGTAMTLRLDGTGNNIGTVTYNTTTGDIKAAKGSTEGNVALVVQGNDGRNDWYYSKQITGTEIVNVSDIVAESNTPASIDLSNCNIWIETTESNVAYALDATEVTISSISSVAITGIETPAANTTLDTSASCATTGVSSTSPSVTWTPNDSKAGYNTSYTASITLTADTFYEFADNVAATVLGINATSVTKNADGTLTVTYKFNATAPNPSQEPIYYDILDGADSNRTLNSDGSLSIRGSGEFFKFVGVKVDGTLIDAKHYTVKEGSTIITLKADYLDTLSVGNHTIEIVWTDGSASTRFTIKENEEINGPNTGDTFNYLWIMALMISGLTLVVLGRKKKIS